MLVPSVSAGGEMQDIHIHVTHHNFPARSKYKTVINKRDHGEKESTKVWKTQK